MNLTDEHISTGNVAYKKWATQNGTKEGYTADRSVDGEIGNRQYGGGSCSKAEMSNTIVWFQVDLGRLHLITAVTVYSKWRRKCTFPLSSI